MVEEAPMRVGAIAICPIGKANRRERTFSDTHCVLGE
jgi:hypothetical protein